MLSAYILTSTSFQGTDWLENSHPREKSCISDNISVEHTVLSTIASLYVQKKNVKLMLKWYQLSTIRALHAHDITKSNINEIHIGHKSVKVFLATDLHRLSLATKSLFILKHINSCIFFLFSSHLLCLLFLKSTMKKDCTFCKQWAFFGSIHKIVISALLLHHAYPKRSSKGKKPV